MSGKFPQRSVTTGVREAPSGKVRQVCKVYQVFVKHILRQAHTLHIMMLCYAGVVIAIGYVSVGMHSTHELKSCSSLTMEKQGRRQSQQPAVKGYKASLAQIPRVLVALYCHVYVSRCTTLQWS